MKSFTKIILLAGWVIAWTLWAWLEIGPYAIIVEAQIKSTGECNLTLTDMLVYCAALVPVLVAFMSNVREGSLLTWVPRLYKVLIAALIAYIISVSYNLWTLRIPARLTGIEGIESISSFLGRDFVSADLIKSFDFMRETEIKEIKGITSRRDTYLPAKTPFPQDKPVILVLSSSQMSALVTQHPDPDASRRHDSGTSHLPPTITIFGVNSHALGDIWSVETRPVPYLVRKGLQLDPGILFAHFVTAGHRDASGWLTSPIILLFGCVALAYWARKDPHLWGK